jgi:hypothetical protein
MLSGGNERIRERRGRLSWIDANGGENKIPLRISLSYEIGVVDLLCCTEFLLLHWGIQRMGGYWWWRSG